MFSSFCTHVLFLVSLIVFSFSLISFILRLSITDDVFVFEEARSALSRRSVFDDKHRSEVEKKYFKNASFLQVQRSLTAENTSSAQKAYRSVLDRFTFVNSPNPTCIYPGDPENFVIIIILSRAINFDYRQVIRATWGRNGKYQKNRVHVQTIFFVGTDDSVQSAIRNEQIIFNDVIEIGNLTEKQQLIHRCL